MENDKQNPSTPIDQAHADTDIEAETKRLSEQWGRPAAPRKSGERGRIEQKLSHGRSRPVTVEVKRSPRQIVTPR